MTRWKPKLGLWGIRLLVYTLFVLGGICVCLAVLAFLGVLTVRLALEIPMGFAPGVWLLAGAALFFVLGFATHAIAARQLSRRRPSEK